MKLWGVVGWKNTGKTGTVERLVAEFTARGLRVSTIKYTHHGVDLEVSGTDTHRHRVAGAAEVVLASPSRVAILHELRGAPEPGPEALMARLNPVDLVIAEGFKSARHPKVETHRAETGKPLIAREDATVRAVASDAPIDLDRPVLDLDDTRAIADFIAAELGL